MEYFEIIKKLRKEKDWTQQQLAEQLQVSRQTVARWESGWNVPNFLSAQKMAELFGVSVGELMTGERSLEGAPVKRAQMLPAVIWFSALCILSAVLYRVLGIILPTFSKALGAVFLSEFLLLAVWWGIKLLEMFLNSDDGYARKLFYSAWRIGLWFYGAAVCILCMGAFFEISFVPVLEICGSVFAGTFCFVFIDTLLKLILRKKMVIGQNPLKICDIVFLAVSALSLTALAVIAGISHARDAMIYFIVFWALLGLFGIGYLLLRALLSVLMYRKRANKE